MKVKSQVIAPEVLISTFTFPSAKLRSRFRGCCTGTEALSDAYTLRNERMEVAFSSGVGGEYRSPTENDVTRKVLGLTRDQKNGDRQSVSGVEAGIF